jgi:hypothetical protein
MKAISLDIETLDTTTSSIVLSIGACVVLPGRDTTSTPSFYKRLSIQEQINAGRTISEGTLRFWMGQRSDVRHNTMGEEGKPVRYVLEALRDWWMEQGAPPVYVKGSQFDAAIVDDLADTFAVDRPIHYRKWRDVRTLEDIMQWGGREEHLIMVRENTSLRDKAHDALADAQMQGEEIAFVMETLRDG